MASLKDIPVVTESRAIRSGEKYVTAQGFTAIKDGQKPRDQAPAPTGRKPAWIRAPLPVGAGFGAVKDIVHEHRLATVCEEAKCPNIGECWNAGTATIMLMGAVCTRACRFCSVDTGNPRGWLDAEEPENTARSVELMKLRYIVLTSVNRDDLPDGGATHYAAAIGAIKRRTPHVAVEALTPDFQGVLGDVEKVVDSGLEVFAQNVETVKRLTHPVRDPRASYEQTLSVLAHAKKHRPDVLTKTSLMLGLGETDEEIAQTMDDLRAIDVDLLTLGQYLRPTVHHLPVQRFVTPAEFDRYREWALAKGFRECVSGPLVRSSYRAERALAGNNAGIPRAAAHEGDVAEAAPSVKWLGRVEYEPTWREMQRITDTRDEHTPDEIWLLEHPPVFTLGLNADAGHVLGAGDIPVVKIDRGGQVTYHGPGQLVVYPLIDIRRAGLGVRDLVTAMERAVIEYCHSLGITAATKPGAPGVYVAGNKIGSVGIRIRRGASYHGLAFNVNMDLEPFQRINPCGYAGLQMTQLAALGQPDATVEETGRAFAPFLTRALESLRAKKEYRDLRERLMRSKATMWLLAVTALRVAVATETAPPVELVVIDLRPPEEKEGFGLSPLSGKCNEKVFRIADVASDPLKIEVLKADLVEHFALVGGGGTLTVLNWSIYYNKQVQVRGGGPSSIGVGGYTIPGMKKEKRPGSKCSRKESAGGWYEGDEVQSQYFPLISEFEGTFGGKPMSVRVVHSPRAKLEGEFNGGAADTESLLETVHETAVALATAIAQ